MLLLSIATLILPSEMVPMLVQLPLPLDVVVVSQALNIKAANTVAAREKRLIFIKPHYLQKVSRYYP
jgi:hypothetical protein